MEPTPRPNSCMKCGSDRVVPGIAFSYAGSSEAFQPTGFNKWRFTLFSTVKMNSFACQDCGLIWKMVDPADLAEFIKANCTK